MKIRNIRDFLTILTIQISDIPLEVHSTQELPLQSIPINTETLLVLHKIRSRLVGSIKKVVAG